jgi:hypothetical protein
MYFWWLPNVSVGGFKDLMQRWYKFRIKSKTHFFVFFGVKSCLDIQLKLGAFIYSKGDKTKFAF